MLCPFRGHGSGVDDLSVWTSSHRDEAVGSPCPHRLVDQQHDRIRLGNVLVDELGNKWIVRVQQDSLQPQAASENGVTLDNQVAARVVDVVASLIRYDPNCVHIEKISMVLPEIVAEERAQRRLGVGIEDRLVILIQKTVAVEVNKRFVAQGGIRSIFGIVDFAIPRVPLAGIENPVLIVVVEENTIPDSVPVGVGKCLFDSGVTVSDDCDRVPVVRGLVARSSDTTSPLSVKPWKSPRLMSSIRFPSISPRRSE